MGLELVLTKNSHPALRYLMPRHYSNPNGFVGRNICYAILFDRRYYGHIVAGSATRYLPNQKQYRLTQLNHIVNNTFFHVTRRNGRYPVRNFTDKIVSEFESKVKIDWFVKYGDIVKMFETLVELPRTGEVYKRVGWVYIGITKGFTCKRIAGESSDNWSGKRIWNTVELRPKLVFVKYIPVADRYCGES